MSERVSERKRERKREGERVGERDRDSDREVGLHEAVGCCDRQQAWQEEQQV